MSWFVTSENDFMYSTVMHLIIALLLILYIATQFFHCDNLFEAFVYPTSVLKFYLDLLSLFRSVHDYNKKHN